MTTSPFVGITLLESDSQAGAYLKVNDAIQILEWMAQLRVKDRDLLTPPGSPADGDAYLMPSSGTLLSTWASVGNNNLVISIGGLWYAVTRKEGMRVRIMDENRWLQCQADSGSWIEEALKSKIVIVNPGSAENIAFDFLKRAVTLRRVNYVAKGTTPSVTFDIKRGTDRSAAGTSVLSAPLTVTNTTTGVESTAFASSGAVAAASWLWLTTSASSGPATELAVVLEYTED